MTLRIDSLRLRLVATLAGVFGLGVLGAIVAAPFEASAVASLPDMLDEPYQDIAVLVPCGLMMLALIWFVSGWSLRHVATASRQAAALGPGNLDARVPLDGLPAEMRPLVEAFNDALARVSDAYAAERRFLADAAHELRTPLSVLSLRVQRARQGALDWSAVEGDVDRVSRLANQLLELSQRDHVARTVSPGCLEVVDLARIAREAAALTVPLAEQAGRRIVVDLPRTLPVRGRPGDLRDLLRNLLDNALEHGRGTIHLVGDVGRVGDAVAARIEISDEGPGVPPGFETTAFERFTKAERSSAGHGLGLAIVQETVRIHGGRVAILPGPGCRVRLELPAPELGAAAQESEAA